MALSHSLRRMPARFRPTFARLEDRAVPAIVNFQQGLDGYASTQDTDLFSVDPDVNFSDNTFVSVDQQDFNGVHHGLLRFDNIFGTDPGQIPLGSVINSAKLTLHIINESNLSALVSLYRMNIDWNESTSTWNSFGPLGGVQTDGVEAERLPDFILGDTATQGFKEFDIGATVQSWANGLPNFGWAIIQYGTNGWDWETSEAATKQPLLTVDFTPPSGAGQFIVNAAASTTQAEGDAAAQNTTVFVSRVGGNTGTVSVDYTIAGLTATAGADFDDAKLKGTLTFGPTDVILPVTIPVIGDALIEGPETFTVTLSNPTGGAALGKTTVQTVTIADDDLLVNEILANVSGQADDGYEYIELLGAPNATLPAGTYLTVFEGETEEAGGGVGVADIVIDLSGKQIGSNGLLVVAPSGFKFTPAAGTGVVTAPELSFTGGKIEDSSLTVAVISSPTTAIVQGKDYDASTGTGLDVGVFDALPADARVYDHVGWTEGGGSDNDRVATLFQPGPRLNQPTGQPTGPADDKSVSSDAASRFPGDRSPNFNGAWFNGDILVPTVPVAYASAPFGYVNNPAGAQLTPGVPNTQLVVSFAAAATKVDEVAGSVTVTVNRVGDTSGTATVKYATQDGSAKAGVDYTAVNGVLTFEPGEGSDTFAITLTQDGIPEGFESFSVVLSQPSSPFLLATAKTTITVVDADAKVATFQDGDLPTDYQGTQDAAIAGWLQTDKLGFDLRVDVDGADINPTNSEDKLRPNQALLRFDDLFGDNPGQVPFGSQILNAFVTFNVVNPSSGVADIRFFKLNDDWNEFDTTWAQPTVNAKITNGVTPDDVEAYSTPDAVVGAPTAAGFVEVSFSTESFQAWANKTATNNGWVIVNDVDDDWNFISSNGIGAANRPRLTLVYTPPTGAGVFRTAEPEVRVNEGEQAKVLVHRVGGSTGAETLTYTITAGSGSLSDVNASATGTVTFNSGDLSAFITIPTINDTNLEADETLTITISGTGVTIDRATTTLVIRDNDFNVNSPSLLINELIQNSPGSDQPWEFFEFSGTAGAGMGGLTFVIIEGDNNNFLGDTDLILDMSMATNGTNGITVFKGEFGGFAIPPEGATVITNRFLDSDNSNPNRGTDSDHTNGYFLLFNPTRELTQYFDYDWDNDGVLEFPEGTVVVDVVGHNDAGGGDITYGGVSLPLPLDSKSSPIYVPDGISRVFGNTTAKSVDAWFYGDLADYDDSIRYRPELSTKLPVAGAALSPGQPNVQASTPLVALSKVIVDDGVQTSSVRSLTLQFSGPVDRTITNALQLQNQQGNPVAGVNLNVTGLYTNTLTITFSGSPVVGGSLPDGDYRLVVDGRSIISQGRAVDGANNGTSTSIGQYDFNRLYGDSNADGKVDFSDFLQFRSTFGLKTGDAGFNGAFDFDGDGDVDFNDFLQFRARFGS